MKAVLFDLDDTLMDRARTLTLYGIGDQPELLIIRRRGAGPDPVAQVDHGRHGLEPQFFIMFCGHDEKSV